MLDGVVFDIKEFAVHDGPGLRLSVFLKGCPLRCSWCHNPEGIAREPQQMVSAAGTRLVGRRMTSRELADRINAQAAILRANDGGVTFTGGEPLMQAPFVTEVIDQLGDTHVLLDTSGLGTERAFRDLATRCDLVYFDLKLANSKMHRKHTGRDNLEILRNLNVLGELDVPFVVRIPLVPGVTDTPENLSAIAERVSGFPGLVRVDQLPYNGAAGAKYEACGMTFNPTYDETRPCAPDPLPFKQRGIAVRVA